MKKLAEESSLGFTSPFGYATSNSGDFLKRWAAPAIATTLGAGGLAAYLSKTQKHLGETKKERTRRILRNALLASGATATAWLGKAGYSGLDALGDLKYNDKTTGFFDTFQNPVTMGQTNSVESGAPKPLNWFTDLFTSESGEMSLPANALSGSTVGMVAGGVRSHRRNNLIDSLNQYATLRKDEIENFQNEPRKTPATPAERLDVTSKLNNKYKKTLSKVDLTKGYFGPKPAKIPGKLKYTGKVGGGAIGFALMTAIANAQNSLMQD